jgi:hypothetical protein
MKSWRARLEFLAAISVKILRCFYNNNTIPANQKNSILKLKTKESEIWEFVVVSQWTARSGCRGRENSRFRNCKSIHSRANNLVVDKEQLLFPQ